MLTPGRPSERLAAAARSKALAEDRDKFINHSLNLFVIEHILIWPKERRNAASGPALVLPEATDALHGEQHGRAGAAPRAPAGAARISAWASKAGNCLRVETTIAKTKAFKVLRPL